MKINIDLKEDERLRKEIRKLIEGQVISVTRSELKEIVVSQSKNLTPEKLEAMAANEIKQRVKQVTSEDTWREDTKKLEKLARLEIAKKIDGIEDKIIDLASTMMMQAMENKLAEFINKEVEKAVAKRLKSLLE